MLCLFVDQKLLEDIESHRNRALMVLHKHSELRTLAGDSTPGQQTKMATEIKQLQGVAREQSEQLKEAVAQQDQYEVDIKHLTAAISQAQQKLLTSPVTASSVDALKKQIAEHNVCTSLTEQGT